MDQYGSNHFRALLKRGNSIVPPVYASQLPSAVKLGVASRWLKPLQPMFLFTYTIRKIL
jgi:hypothetical protein